MVSASRVLHGMRQDREAVFPKTSTIFGRVEAAMVERLAFEAAHGFPIRWTTREKERSFWSRKSSEN